MTVGELIEELKNYPDWLEVFITDETLSDSKINIEYVSDSREIKQEDAFVTLVTNAYQGT